MILKNTTQLDTERLLNMFLEAIDGWPHQRARVFVRYSRGADFSGTCYYKTSRIFVNLGRHNRYPYRLDTHIARPRSNRTHWWRELYSIQIARAEELALFIFMHEFYHFLVRRAGRNVRQKEGRCDRFATRVLVQRYGAIVRDSDGNPVGRDAWDFQDLDGFVAAAKRAPRQRFRHLPANPMVNAREPSRPKSANEQLFLFPH